MEYFRYQIEESMDDFSWTRIIECHPCFVVTKHGRAIEIQQYCVGADGEIANHELIQLNAACVKDLGRFLLELAG